MAAATQATAMDLSNPNSISCLLLKEKPSTWANNHHINLFLFVLPEPDLSSRICKLSLGLYLTFTNASGNPIQSTAVAAGKWEHKGGSYLGYTINKKGEQEYITFNKGLENKIWSADCPYWIVSDIKMEVPYDAFGNASVDIPWHWAVDGYGSEKFVNIVSPSGIVPITLDNIGAKTYTITYDPNGGTSAPADQTKTHDINIRISSKIPSYDKHIFTGWNAKQDGSGESYSSYSIYAKNSDITLYAQWQRVYEVTYDANGGEGEPQSQQKRAGEALTLSYDTPTREGHIFSCWITPQGTVYLPGESYTLDSDLTLTAEWLAYYTITYDANEGINPPSSQRKYEDVRLKLSSTQPIRESFNFIAWNTKKDGSGDSYQPSDYYYANSNVTLYAQWEASYTSCEKPWGLSLTDNNDNTATLSCVIGNDGTNNYAEGVQFYVTFDGTAPSASNYHYTKFIEGMSGLTVEHNISFVSWSQEAVEKYFGSACSGQIKFTAVTKSDLSSEYDSEETDAISSNFVWYSQVSQPKFLKPNKSNEIIGSLDSYTVSWTSSNSGINNGVTHYSLIVRNITTGLDELERILDDSVHSYNFSSNTFTKDNIYQFVLKAIGDNTNFSSSSTQSGYLIRKDIKRFSNFALTVSDGSTLPSTDVYGHKTYIDSGSGNVLKLTWETPKATNNSINYYMLLISYYSEQSGEPQIVLSKDVGYTNVFYLDSSVLAQINQDRYQIVATVMASSDYGLIYSGTSDSLILYISKGSGTYIKVEDGYKQPIMKRAAALSRVNDPNKAILLLSDDNFILSGSDDIEIYAKNNITYEWAVMHAFYAKDSNNTWQQSDIKYEVLTDNNGEIILDSNNEPIYIL